MINATQVTCKSDCNTCKNLPICNQSKYVKDINEKISQRFCGSDTAIYINIYCPYYEEVKVKNGDGK